MDLRIMMEPQFGATYLDQLGLARAAEDARFSAFFRSDHYLAMGGAAGLPGPTDSWVTLGALARETTRIRLGTMVTSATFRLPGPLAIAVAQVDEMSGGRVELGLGTGWFEDEHTAYGIPFPPVGERFDRLEEQLSIITGLWGSSSRFSFSGKHYTIVDSPGLPKPVQSPVPLIVGGSGPRRTPALAARFAAEFNTVFVSPSEAAARFSVVREACSAAGRSVPPVFSVMVPVAVGSRDADVARRASVYGSEPGSLVGVVGSPAQALESIEAYREAGAGRIYLQMLDLADLDQVGLIGAEVIPLL